MLVSTLLLEHLTKMFQTHDAYITEMLALLAHNSLVMYYGRVILITSYGHI